MGVVIVALLVGGYRVYTTLYRPYDLFEPTEQRTAEVTAQTIPAFDIQDYLSVEEKDTEEEEIVPPELLATATPAATQSNQTAAPTEKIGRAHV